MASDLAFAAICAWLRAQGLTAQTQRDGRIILRIKGTRIIVRTL